MIYVNIKILLNIKIMFVYKNVVRYGRYCPSIVKNKKIKLKKMKCQQRIL